VEYVLDKIGDAPLVSEPFPHLYIEDLFAEDDLAELLRAREIATGGYEDDAALLEGLADAGYDVIRFPGCVTDLDEYLCWHRERRATQLHHSACEGFGVALRLSRPQSPIVQRVAAMFSSAAMIEAMAARFGVRVDRARYDWGLQKYLDGYEISPHPDIRRKALTYMVNINPYPGAERCDHHTHLMRFTAHHRYVRAYWASRPDRDRCWVPWGWCETVTQQRANNSMVIFAPTDDTLHAVRARYDHLIGQRTQLYGNLWYMDVTDPPKPEWEDLVIHPGRADRLRADVGAALQRVRNRLERAHRRLKTRRARPARRRPRVDERIGY
jgi:hypothetical protein